LTMADSSGSCGLVVQPTYAMVFLFAEDPAHYQYMDLVGMLDAVAARETGLFCAWWSDRSFNKPSWSAFFPS
ncbi:hypothetical protein, partial [Desulfomicrobium macestii]|uniref:hypothetical protein n=1 Tax=Desulfomicrobium macestii TaxID=90731 RepID=UPI001CEF2DD6